MSNYPPGVTGHEPEIAGYPERTEDVTCYRQDAEVLYRFEVLDRIGLALNTTGGPTPEGLARLYAEVEELTEAEAACEWSGEIDGYVSGDDFTWTCPRCGADNEERGLYEPDPDEGRDR